MQARTGRPKPSNTPSSLSRRNSLKKKKSWNIKNINKKNKAGKLNLQMRQALAFSLNMAGAIPDDVKSLDSDQDAYNGTYFRNNKGPVVVVAGLKNASKETLQELSADIGAMHQFDPPNEIYLDLDDSLKDNARNQVIKNTLKEVDNIMAPPGKEYRRALFNGFAKLRLVDIPDPIMPQNRLMSTVEFVQSMGEQPKATIRPDQSGSTKPKTPTRYDAIVKALDDYHTVLEQQIQQISRTPDQPDLTKKELNAANKLVQAKGEILETALNDYLDNSKSWGRLRKNINNDKKYRAAENLLKQFFKANPNQLPGDLNSPIINEVLYAVRLNNINRKYKPLQNAQVDVSRQGMLLGEGKSGKVFSKFFIAPNRPDLPGNFEAAVKFENDSTNDDAVDAGIPRNDPEEAKRAVTSYKLNTLLGLNVIPPTEFFIDINEKTGRQEVGLAMERVIGKDGQRKVQNQMLPVNVDLTINILQKELSDLQLLDNVIGHADRNFGNVRFEGTGPNQVTGVKGIDNDDTFGYDWKASDPTAKYQLDKGSKTPGMPPIIDVYTAINFLKVKTDDLEPLKDILSSNDYDATVQRFQNVQATIRQRIQAGNLAIMPGQTLSNQDKVFLVTESNLANSSTLNNLPQWGSTQVYNAHMTPPAAPGIQPKDNSYLGIIAAMAQTLGTVNW